MPLGYPLHIPIHTQCALLLSLCIRGPRGSWKRRQRFSQKQVAYVAAFRNHDVYARQIAAGYARRSGSAIPLSGAPISLCYTSPPTPGSPPSSHKDDGALRLNNANVDEGIASQRAGCWKAIMNELAAALFT